jgi:hypothetical protein
MAVESLSGRHAHLSYAHYHCIERDDCCTHTHTHTHTRTHTHTHTHTHIHTHTHTHTHALLSKPSSRFHRLLLGKMSAWNAVSEEAEQTRTYANTDTL